MLSWKAATVPDGHESPGITPWDPPASSPAHTSRDHDSWQCEDYEAHLLMAGHDIRAAQECSETKMSKRR